jgi:hypothetical protein
VSTPPQELAERVVATMMERDAFSRWLGIELVALGPGGCTVPGKMSFNHGSNHAGCQVGGFGKHSNQGRGFGADYWRPAPQFSA